VVVEDEPHARQNLRELATALPWLELIAEAGDGRGAVALIDRERPDLVFLDVELPELSGLEVLRALAHRPEIVFTTAYDRFALAAFEAGALDYLVKPFGRQRFVEALERVHRRLRDGGPPVVERALAALPTPSTRLFARTRDGIVPLAIATITRAQAQGDYVEVHSSTGRHLLHLSLGDLVRRLDPERFLQIHRAHVVNLDAVVAMTPFDDRRLLVRLRDGTQIVASRSASEALRRAAR
jgi:two-component system LytT family response regulator